MTLREHAGIGPKSLQQLLISFGAPQDCWKSDEGEIAELPRFGARKEEQIHAARPLLPLVVERLEDYERRGIDLVTVLDPDYPDLLREIDAPPPYFYYSGDLEILRLNTVAIVGSHEASAEGIAEAVRLGKKIAATGAVVVSGLARGIDGGAHVGAIQDEGRTVAVLGSGLDEIYPPEHAELAEQIKAHGLLLSEYRPETKVAASRLIARNRVIVGLARSVIVVEVTEGSGGTVAAISETQKQGKLLFSCFDINRKGAATNELGAVQLRAADDWKMVLRYMV
ncbi:MAG: DNA-processing protein DprA [bacterium]